MTTVSDETRDVVPAEPSDGGQPDGAHTDVPDTPVSEHVSDIDEDTNLEAAEPSEAEDVSAEGDRAVAEQGTDVSEVGDAVTEQSGKTPEIAGEAAEADTLDDTLDDEAIEADLDETLDPGVTAAEPDLDTEADAAADAAAGAPSENADDTSGTEVAPGPRIAYQLDPRDDTWWKSAVFYQIYPRSFADSDGDGVGDLTGVIQRLGYLELLGIDAIWLSPIMRSPMADHGYDVSNPRDIDPLFGDLETFDILIAEAHDRDIRVTMDLVPNHTSDQHEWFRAALAAGPGSPERERYIFRDGRGDNGDEPPNNWHSIFGGPAWTRVTEPDGSPGQWYLHIFAAEQPDLNWEHPDVWADLERTLRFWLDRGVDGFRIDVAHGMAKPADLPDMDLSRASLLSNDDDDPRFNNYAVHDIHRKIRSVLDEYPGAANVGEIWVNDNERFAEYLRPDELHLGFNFRLAKAPFEAGAIREAIENSLDAVLSVAGTPTWTLSNHDVTREVTRYAPVDPETGELDLVRGTRRARAMIVVEMALPGSVFIYNGAELGLPNVDDLPDEVLQDPVWERSGHTERGRDGCRIPLPWEGTEPPFGFSSSQRTWLPIPESWRSLTVEAQLEDVGSMLSLYRAAIELRVQRPEFAGDAVEWYGAPEGCLAFRRDEGHLVCALNAGEDPVPLPPGELLLISSPLVDGMLAPDSAAWLV
ncbi:glycoside hydrolase family 13 protein [Gordonia aurantiaca]|uniref:glycoside hydrolase family 13 protein n=1 Tax=Gordonia sp. B21 TaxID=3151852 RepID=UPI00326472DF